MRIPTRVPLALLVTLVAATPVSAQNSGFGRALIVGDGEVLVGEPANNFRPGRVYVYRKTDGGWTRSATLSAPGAERADGFGSTLALAGDVLFVAARGTTIEVFRRGSGGAWQPAGTIGGRAEDNERFASAMAAWGDWLLVGAPGVAAGGGRGRGGRGGNDAPPEPGSVYLFRRDGDGGWSQRARIRPSGSAPGDAFGSAIAVDDGVALIGAPGANGGAGVAHAFALGDGGAPRELLPLAPTAPLANERFGSAVALSGARAAIGAPGADGGRGAAFVFQRDADAWVQQSRLQEETFQRQDGFGAAVAIAGNDLWVGAPTPPGNLTGWVTQFRAQTDGSFAPVNSIWANDTDARDAFGQVVSMRGNVAAVAATGMDHNAGAVQVYELDTNGRWVDRGRLLSEPDNLSAITGGERRCSTEGTVEIFACGDVELVALLPPSALVPAGKGRGVRLNDLWGWTDPDTGREYALVGRTDGTSFVDITDPERPVVVGDLPQPPGLPPSPTWRDIKTYRNHAFIVADAAGEHGVQVFDLTQLRDVQGPPVTFTATAHYRGINSAHNIVINEETGFAYSVGSSAGGETCGGGLHMIDIRDPRSPTFAGCFADTGTGRRSTGYSHDAQCVLYRGPDARYRGREICIGLNENTVSIADVTDKANPRALSRIAYPNPSYTHQGWFTEDQRYFFVDDESDEIAGTVDRTRTLVYDLTDLEDPKLSLEFLGTTSASDHNLYIKDNLMYQSNYRAGLRIIDVSNPLVPREVGFFDTAPYLADGPGFSGTWSNYPFFESGIILVSSVQEGLFLVRKRRVVS
jgi:choice-of-anchor B domain-containing protein